MSIGWLSLGSEADLHADPLRDSIFPVLAPWWPGKLDQLLVERQQGAWRFDLLTPPSMLRLHLLQAAGPTHSFSQALREIWHAWSFRGWVSVPELGTMTRLRWCHETLQNDVKTRLGLGEVRSQTPEGVLQEVLAHLCLSNFLRLWRHRACPLAPDLPSFTAARDALYQANQQLRAAPEQQAHILGLLEAMLCAQPVVHRPDRSEPRCRRPSKRPYPYFKSPRALWRAERKVG